MKVRPLESHECRDATEILVRAFQNFSLSVYLFPDPVRRPHQARWIYSRFVEMYREIGGAFITEDGMGVALWRPPQYWRGVSAWRYIRAGYLWTPFNIGWELVPRRLKALHDVEQRHRAEISEPHWFLELIGVDPERQCTGSGTALIRHVHEMADRGRLPSYVITHEAKNIGYYERHGFRHIKSEPALPGAPPTCSLLRPPAASSS